MTIQTQHQSTHDLRLAARKELVPVGESSWLAGFANMFAKELGEWFRTNRWLWQLLIWLILINGMTAVTIWVLPILGQEAKLPPDIQGLFMYFSIMAMTGTIGVIILAQDEIIQEKQSGTAAWILSKPAARSAFILTKFLSNLFGVLVFIVALPGLTVLGEIFLASHKLVPLVPFFSGAAVVMLEMVFFLSLVILLGVLFEARGPVLGISLGIMFGCRIISNYIPQVALAMPTSMDGFALGIASGSPVPASAFLGVIVTAVLSIVFILVALWRFQHTEL